MTVPTCKREMTAMARLALLGFELHRVGAGWNGYSISNHISQCYLASLDEVETRIAYLEHHKLVPASTSQASAHRAVDDVAADEAAGMITR